MKISINKLPYFVSFAYFIPVGSFYEDKNNNGISHFLEHLILLRKEEIKKELDKFSIEINAFTSYYYTYFLVNTNSKNFLKVYKLIDELIQHPNWSVNLEKEKKLIKKEMLSQN